MVFFINWDIYLCLALFLPWKKMNPSAKSSIEKQVIVNDLD